MISGRRSSVILTAFCILASGCAGKPVSEGASPAEPPLDSALALASFDSVWRVVKNTHYDPALHGVDWDGARRELRPKVAQAKTSGEARAAMTQLLARLGDSHYGIIPADALVDDDGTATADSRLGDVGIDLRMVGRALMVSAVDSGRPAARAGVTAGWIVEAVDTFSTRAMVTAVARTAGSLQRRVAGIRAAIVVERRLSGAVGTLVSITLRDGAGRARNVKLTRESVHGQMVRLGSLPPFLARLDVERRPLAGGCAGMIRFTTWLPMLALPLEKAMTEVRQCDGIVLDLRGNLGGVAAMVMGASGWFLDAELPLGIMKTRESELRFISIPHRVSSGGQALSPYKGPLAILVDHHSASTSEIFAAGLQEMGRARLFGDTTAGQALPATLARLPNHDVLMFVLGDFTSARGVRIEGRGAIPDEVIPLARADLLAGRDAAMDAALRWLGEERARRSHGTVP
jgi:carboxyl-terminal processing protease